MDQLHAGAQTGVGPVAMDQVGTPASEFHLVVIHSETAAGRQRGIPRVLRTCLRAGGLGVLRAMQLALSGQPCRFGQRKEHRQQKDTQRTKGSSFALAHVV